MALFYPHYIHCQFGYLPGSLTTVFLPGAAMIYGAWAMNKIPNCWLVLKWGVVLVWLVVWNMAFIFPYIGNNNPIWHIFFRGVETTNQFYYLINLMIGDSELTHLNLWTYELLIAEVHRACQIWNQRRGDLLTPCVPVLLLVCRGKKGKICWKMMTKWYTSVFFLILDQAT